MPMHIYFVGDVNSVESFHPSGAVRGRLTLRGWTPLRITAAATRAQGMEGCCACVVMCTSFVWFRMVVAYISVWEYYAYVRCFGKCIYRTSNKASLLWSSWVTALRRRLDLCRVLECKRHGCDQPCHAGECRPCPLGIEQVPLGVCL